MLRPGLVAVLLAAVLAAAPARAQTEPAAADVEVTGAVTPAAGASRREAARSARSALPAVVSAMRLTGDGARARLTLDLTRAVEMRAFALADPYRVIVDLDEVNFQVPPATGAAGQGLVRAFRFGLFAPGKSRLVIDLSGPAAVERAEMHEARGGVPPRLVQEGARGDAEGFRRTLGERVASNLAHRGDREAQRPRTSPSASAEAGTPVVVIDPGHGGIDPGAAARSGDAEKDIVLAFAQVLRDKLKGAGRYQVVMTRDTDVFVPLAERVRLAREAGAALFVSVHADSIRGAEDNARGVTVYTLSDRASDADSARLAERENKADAIAGLDLSDEPSEVADILIDLTRRETRMFSASFARLLAGEMRHATRMHRLPLRAAGFQVLRAHDIPSVLVELGFVSSAKDVEMLTSAIWRDRTADSVVKAIDQFFARRTAVRPTAGR